MMTRQSSASVSLRAATNILISALAMVSTTQALASSSDEVRPADHKLVVTLGDSYGAGTGTHAQRKDYDDQYCLVEHDTTPGGRYAFSKDVPHIVTACAGDEIIDTVRQWNDLAQSLPEQFDSGWEGSVLIFSSGGNSLRTNQNEGFPQFYRRCVTATCSSESDELVNLDQVQSELLGLYQQVVSEAPLATIRVMGYPRPMNSNNLWCFVPGVTVSEAHLTDHMADQIVELTRGVIETVRVDHPTVDIEFVDVRPYYQTGSCHLGPRQVRGINWRLLGSSFHPTQRGYDSSEKAFLASVPSESTPNV